MMQTPELFWAMGMLLPLFLGAVLSYVSGKITSRIKGDRTGGLVAAAITLAVTAGVYILSLAYPHISIGGSAGPVGWLGTLEPDALSLFMVKVIFPLIILVAIYSIGYMRDDLGTDKYYALLLIMTGGMVGVACAGDIVSLYVFFEILSISSYCLVSFRKESWEPIEAGFKYVITNALGSTLAILGLSLLYLYSGSLSMSEIAAQISGWPELPVMAALVLVITGFGVKAAMVPLHSWLPDAHSAAPSGISALLSGIVIQVGFFAMLRLILTVFSVQIQMVGLVLIVFAAITMTYGNYIAIAQSDIKRMLAYSSVAQMGYIILGFGVGFYYQSVNGFTGGLFHIETHAFMKALAFLSAGYIIERAGTRRIGALKGAGRVMPLAGIAFTIAALGLAGIPAFSGFMSKLMIYKSGFQAGTALGIVLSSVAIANSIISLGYYMPAIHTLFSPGGTAELQRKGRAAPAAVMLPVVVMALVTLVLGWYPELGLGPVNAAVTEIFKIIGG
ncbi:MAG TPA: proton-conducting transporter membrane subunit [Bacillota bacterium]|nr:proton-conducting transporter membrane subunit [Bacillota bacterium]